jgi:hypothetical protein
MQLRTLALAVALACGAMTGPALIAATQPDADSDPFTRIPAAGSGPDGMDFVGTMDIRAFEVRDGRLVAVGALSGRVIRTTGAAAEPVARLDEAPVGVPVGTVAATCERLGLAFGPLPLDTHGPEVLVDPIRIEAADRTAAGQPAEVQLCAVADRLRQAAGPPALAEQLAAVAESFH